MKPKLLLYVINDPAFLLSHRKAIAIAAQKAGYRVGVAAPPSNQADEILNAGLEFFPLTTLTRWGYGPWREIAAIAELTALFRTVRPDLVHLVTIKPVLYGTLAARIAKVPAVAAAISGRGYVFLSAGPIAAARRRIIHLLYRLILRHRNQKVIFQNGDDLRYFTANRLVKAPHAVLIRGSGVDLARFAPAPRPRRGENGTPIVMFASRLLKEKGIFEFVEAARLAASQGIACRWVVVGSRVPGNPGSIDETAIDSWKREGAIELWGERQRMEEVLAQASIVCLPSYGEGLPKVLLEAAACAKPIVTCDVSGCREVVVQGVNGFLVEPGKAGPLAESIIRLIKDPGLLDEMGKRSRQLVESGGFSEEAIVQKTLELYGSLSSQGR